MKTILVADDEDMSRVILEEALTAEGYRVISVENGEEVLKSLKTEEPDLLILDVKMPLMDGIETLQKLRITHPTLPVIMLTAYRSMEQYAVKEGISAFIPKPLNLQRLKSKVRKILKD
jgi:DNA-binding NtrC family response regulator